MYCAIIGDMVKSRELIDRELIQEKLKDILTEINEKYSSNIASNFTITIGDEFQGLLKNPSNLMEIISRIKIAIYPLKLRFGIGFGRIDTKVIKELAIGSDGPAYHWARSAIKDVKSTESMKEIPESGIKIITKSTKNNHDELINSLFSFCYFIEKKWTAKQVEVIHKLLLKEQTQQALASELKIGQSSIQRRLQGAGFIYYQNALQTIDSTLTNEWSEYAEH